MDLSGDLTQFFEERLASLKCDVITRQYINQLFKKPVHLEMELPIVVQWHSVRESGQFERIQTLADSVFWTRVFAPEYFRHATVEYYDAIGATAYARCHVIMRRQLPVYGELADRFTELAHESRQLIVIGR